jgi:hypothetical protein
LAVNWQLIEYWLANSLAILKFDEDFGSQNWKTEKKKKLKN